MIALLALLGVGVILGIGWYFTRLRCEPLFVTTRTECDRACRIMSDAGALLAVDIEGVELGRTGTICLIQIAVADGPVYVFDILQVPAVLAEGCSLRGLLQHKKVKKLMYDSRKDADALWHLHATRLEAVVDLQVLYTCSRQVSGKWLHGLSKALTYVLPSYKSKQLAELKGMLAFLEAADVHLLVEYGRKAFDPSRGGSFEVWRQRPLDPRLLQYAAADVQYLFNVYNSLSQFMCPERLREVSEHRIRKTIGRKDPVNSSTHNSAIRDFKLRRRDYRD